jgi:dihydroorotase
MVCYLCTVILIEMAIIRFVNNNEDSIKKINMKLNHQKRQNYRFESPFHNKTVDILIVDGLIKKNWHFLTKFRTYRRNTIRYLHVSQGWFDSSVSLGEPGFEDRELQTDFRLLQKWFWFIALQPNSFPVIDNQSQVNFVLNKALDLQPNFTLLVH